MMSFLMRVFWFSVVLYVREVLLVFLWMKLVDMLMFVWMGI